MRDPAKDRWLVDCLGILRLSRKEIAAEKTALKTDAYTAEDASPEVEIDVVVEVDVEVDSQGYRPGKVKPPPPHHHGRQPYTPTPPRNGPPPDPPSPPQESPPDYPPTPPQYSQPDYPPSPPPQQPPGYQAPGAYGRIGPDCKPWYNQVAGPKNHVLCKTHGHVYDSDSGMIIANSVEEYDGQYPCPRPMSPDCKPLKGKMPYAPKCIMLCAHGHVLNTDTGQIVGNTMTMYLRAYPQYGPPKKPPSYPPGDQPPGYGGGGSYESGEYGGGGGSSYGNQTPPAKPPYGGGGGNKKYR